MTYRPGDGRSRLLEVLVDVNGTRRKAWLFLMRLMYLAATSRGFTSVKIKLVFSTVTFARLRTSMACRPASVRQSAGRLVRILVGGARTLTPRFAALASHYLVEACFCRPGEGHDKGGVESRGKAVRQQALVPIPVGSTLAVINETLLAQMDARLETQRDAAGQTIGVRFTEEQGQFRLLPTPFAPEATTLATVPPRALVRLEGAVYSVPSRWAGLDLVVRIGATTVAIVGREWTEFCIRASGLSSGPSTIGILSELARKPQAVRQVLPDLLRDLGDPFPAIWDRLQGAHGPREAARLFAKVLGQLDTYGAAVVVPALAMALATGTPPLLALTPARSTPGRVALDAIPAVLRDIAVTSGCAADYDGWLRGGAA